MVVRSFSRRHFLRDTSLIAMASSIPAFLGGTARCGDNRSDGRILVVIQLDGGNDGINTVIPYADPGYARYRRELRIADNQWIKLDHQVALHPSLRPFAELVDHGRLAIVQGVGYPNPNRSHDVSMAIWQTARFDPDEHKSFGWIGRALDTGTQPSAGAPHSILLSDRASPVALRGRMVTSVAFTHLSDLQLKAGATLSHTPLSPHDHDLLAFSRRASLDATSTADLLANAVKTSASHAAAYPESELAVQLHNVAQLIKSGFDTRVYYTIQPGYDTHAAQLQTHSRLLDELSGAVEAFLEDLRTAGLIDRVLLMAFSEFGRRVEENSSWGTDHGTAGPMFLAGGSVRPGLHQATPNLTDLVDGDLRLSVDFRRVYATILRQWLGCDSASVVGDEFLPLDALIG